METNRTFTPEELERAKILACKNMECDETNIGFEFNDAWVVNPFMDSTGRFEFSSLEAMYEYYGMENVCGFLSKILR